MYGYKEMHKPLFETNSCKLCYNYLHLDLKKTQKNTVTDAFWPSTILRYLTVHGQNYLLNAHKYFS